MLDSREEDVAKVGDQHFMVLQKSYIRTHLLLSLPLLYSHQRLHQLPPLSLSYLYIPPPFVLSLCSRTRHTQCTAREAEVRVKTEPKSEADITTDSGEDTEDLVDSDDRDDFNPAGDDEDLQDLNIVQVSGQLGTWITGIAGYLGSNFINIYYIIKIISYSLTDSFILEPYLNKAQYLIGRIILRPN